MNSSEIVDKTGSASSSTRAWLPWVFHMFMMAIYAVGLFNLYFMETQNCSPCFSEKLLGAPITWEEWTFSTNKNSDRIDPYSRHNPDVDIVWEGKIENTISVISEAEKQNLPGGRHTARAYGPQDGYAVMIEVFHQLHCLNHLRTSFFMDRDNGKPGGSTIDPEDHADHCFSYLFQTLLCHADVGVMTVTWHPEWDVFKPQFNVTKQCRNFDAIKDWAHTRKARFFPPQRNFSS
ncbi:hypothetical protein MAA_06600 [Metarhizium robertsii ARSEF 23]|uniref:DUF3328 domain protein n=1 Tax=Metarhizium robertsii (strain ARSEF 23 / ATCC MYA-3075) TaxID=655844 RepID=E9F2V1_METRA|nr:uncharacterized protein MAA_06600 [Metarhizium robertsii ARSEF 23]EFY97817.2 hypothetical protein MAA_06600 [Metarhizium robertsii ARSEF 23]